MSIKVTPISPELRLVAPKDFQPKRFYVSADVFDYGEGIQDSAIWYKTICGAIVNVNIYTHNAYSDFYSHMQNNIFLENKIFVEVTIDVVLKYKQ
jgi:hypothetical protein